MLTIITLLFQVVPPDLKHDHSKHFCTAVYVIEDGEFVAKLMGCIGGNI